MKNNQKLRHDNSGFSLVELIVVIAIMAVLASVAVIGVSVYVDKAGEAADKQLIMDIEDALVMGGYNSSEYAPGKVIGAVAIGATGADFAGSEEINQMMIDAFGENWKQELTLQSEVFRGSDNAKVLDAVKKNPEIFASVPDSSFYGNSNNSDKLAADVDELSTALSTILEGMEGSGNLSSRIWGESFKNTVWQSNLNYDEDDQMAANLTVFAAANAISGASDQEKEALIDSWATGTLASTSGQSGLVVSLAMNFAKCTALKNYVELTYGEGSGEADYVNSYYNKLMRDMNDLKDPSNAGYVGDFDAAIKSFETATEELRTEWENSGKAETDAKAFIASMSAVNALEKTYVSVDKTDVLGLSGAFTEFGAADILDNMVDYAAMGTFPTGSYDYIITLVIDENGVPTVSPALPRN